jgi:hypothetical protein
MRALELTGKRFSRLVVIKRAGSRNGFSQWECICDCGNTRYAIGPALVDGYTKSCGCLYDETRTTCHRTHGERKTRAYTAWSLMRNRCGNPDGKNFDRYGGRGIKVCERWSLFANFLQDMGQPAQGMTLDRINNDGDYEPLNCRWTDRKTQRRNNSMNIRVVLRGQALTLADACEQLGLKLSTVYMRIHRSGWSVERALEITL